MNMVKLLLVLIISVAAFVLLLQGIVDADAVTTNTIIPAWILPYRILFLFLFAAIILFALVGLING